MRFKVRDTGPLEPIEWPDGSSQRVKHITWVEEEILADMGDGTTTPREAMPQLMPLLLPGKSWEEIRAALSSGDMQRVIAYASGKYEQAMKVMEDAAGNGAAGETAPVSPPPTSSGTSSGVLPEATAVPCGAS